MMGKLKSSQAGFSAIETILFVVVIGLLAGIGWYVWYNRATKVAPSTSTPAATSTSSNTTKPAPQKTTSESKYLEIKPWGVKFTLSPSILDAVSVNDDYGVNTYLLSTGSLKNTDCAADHTAGGGYFIRFTTGDYNSETKQTYTSEFPDAVKVSDYYYAWGRNPAAAECSKDAATQNKANKAANEFKATLKTIQQI